MIVSLGGVLLVVLPETSLPSSDMVGWVLIGFSPSILFGEQHSGWIWGALACLSAGLLLVTIPKRRARGTSAP
jgi:uncharacterized membrane protein